jgi:hypothetical protein
MPFQQFKLNLDTYQPINRMFNKRSVLVTKQTSQHNVSKSDYFSQKPLTASLGLTERVRVPITFIQKEYVRPEVFSASSDSRNHKDQQRNKNT